MYEISFRLVYTSSDTGLWYVCSCLEHNTTYTTTYLKYLQQHNHGIQIVYTPSKLIFKSKWFCNVELVTVHPHILKQVLRNVNAHAQSLLMERPLWTAILGSAQLGCTVKIRKCTSSGLSVSIVEYFKVSHLWYINVNQSRFKGPMTCRFWGFYIVFTYFYIGLSGTWLVNGCRSITRP